jgi:hypothetical protein
MGEEQNLGNQPLPPGMGQAAFFLMSGLISRLMFRRTAAREPQPSPTDTGQCEQRYVNPGGRQTTEPPDNFG